MEIIHNKLYLNSLYSVCSTSFPITAVVLDISKFGYSGSKLYGSFDKR